MVLKNEFICSFDLNAYYTVDVSQLHVLRVHFYERSWELIDYNFIFSHYNSDTVFDWVTFLLAEIDYLTETTSERNGLLWLTVSESLQLVLVEKAWWQKCLCPRRWECEVVFALGVGTARSVFSDLLPTVKPHTVKIPQHIQTVPSIWGPNVKHLSLWGHFGLKPKQP